MSLLKTSAIGMRLLARLEGASSSSPPRATHRGADKEVGESLENGGSAAILRGREKKANEVRMNSAPQGNALVLG
jgi:hypothetical protein